MKKNTTIVERYCDICEYEADGEYSSQVYLNGEIYAECYCPVDLCKKHMRIFALYFSNYEYERYDGSEHINKEELIEKMKNFEE